jgi:hypothetical protein
MIFLHLKHIYNINENFNTTTSDISSNRIDEGTFDIATKEEIATYMKNMFIIFLIYFFISFAAFCYSFYLNQKENQSLPVCIACAFNAAYFNIFYFIFILFVQYNTISTFRYVEYLEEIDKLKVPSNLQINKQIFDCIRPPD